MSLPAESAPGRSFPEVQLSILTSISLAGTESHGHTQLQGRLRNSFVLYIFYLRTLVHCIISLLILRKETELIFSILSCCAFHKNLLATYAESSHSRGCPLLLRMNLSHSSHKRIPDIYLQMKIESRGSLYPVLPFHPPLFYPVDLRQEENSKMQPISIRMPISVTPHLGTFYLESILCKTR